jgi:large subunit ribosomal protein L29
MTSKEIREKETSHLQHELAEKQKHLFDLRSQAVTEKLEDPSQLKKTRQDIARMKTILHERALEAQKAAKQETPAAQQPAAGQ